MVIHCASHSGTRVTIIEERIIPPVLTLSLGVPRSTATSSKAQNRYSSSLK